MGNWGVGIFDGDAENDLLDDYRAERERCANPDIAMARVLFEIDNSWDWERTPLYTVVIAAEQILSNELGPDTRARALAALDDPAPDDYLRWCDPDNGDAPDPRRAAMLTELRALIAGHDPDAPIDPSDPPPPLRNEFLAPQIAAYFAGDASEPPDPTSPGFYVSDDPNAPFVP